MKMYAQVAQGQRRQDDQAPGFDMWEESEKMGQ